MYNTSELMSTIDEMVSAAVGMQTNTQNYDIFIKSRDRCHSMLNEYFSYIEQVTSCVKQMNALV